MTLSFAAIVVMALLFERCAEEERSFAPEKVKFSFLLSGNNVVAGEESMTLEIPADASLLLSLKNSTGEIVLTRQAARIFSSGDGYVTESIDLPPGTYSITDFVVVDNEAEELYVLPDNNMANTISVRSNESSTFAMRVINSTGWRLANKAKLKSFVISGRTYELYYNKRGNIDSVVATQGPSRYIYSVTYTHGLIDSVLTISNQVESKNDDFVYDSERRITSYNYYFVMDGPPYYPFPTTITYDSFGNIQTINSDSFTYDRRHNMISGFGATYTYDNGLNPFYRVKNLFPIMVEEPFIARSVLSKHNATSRTDANGNTVYITNVYDSQNRLISNGSVQFFYYD